MVGIPTGEKEPDHALLAGCSRQNLPPKKEVRLTFLQPTLGLLLDAELLFPWIAGHTQAGYSGKAQHLDSGQAPQPLHQQVAQIVVGILFQAGNGNGKLFGFGQRGLWERNDLTILLLHPRPPMIGIVPGQGNGWGMSRIHRGPYSSRISPQKTFQEDRRLAGEVDGNGRP